ncbi:unnamed protein product [marine sediment metagenome]|uniref:Uncharacterized protein n=1 Tax=marine sediment metagenome TaxID=412755 RepID=X1CI18_9ZZZZ
MNKKIKENICAGILFIFMSFLVLYFTYAMFNSDYESYKCLILNKNMKKGKCTYDVICATNKSDILANGTNAEIQSRCYISYVKNNTYDVYKILTPPFFYSYIWREQSSEIIISVIFIW